MRPLFFVTAEKTGDLRSAGTPSHQPSRVKTVAPAQDTLYFENAHGEWRIPVG